MHEQIRSWAQVNLDNIEYNFRSLSQAVGPNCRVLGVVKADAYGHGALPVASRLQSIGCKYLAAATVGEAIALRNGGITIPILILGWTDPRCTEELIAYHITQCISDLAAAKEMSEIAKKLGKKVKVHLKADSGMGRLGFICHDNDPAPEMLRIMELEGLEVEGIFTHFAVSEVEDDGGYTQKQFENFNALADRLERMSGRRFALRHCANSGAVISHPEMMLDMVRPGLALYGLYPGKDRGCIELRPALEVKTKIYQIKHYHAGDSISYGRRFIADSDRTVAVIPMGYADGLHRVLSGKMDMLVHGKRAHQIGSICMDMCMLDITDIPEAKVGDLVTIIGHDGDAFISADEVAEKAGTISYEMFCNLSPRMTRVYEYSFT